MFLLLSQLLSICYCLVAQLCLISNMTWRARYEQSEEEVQPHSTGSHYSQYCTSTLFMNIVDVCRCMLCLISFPLCSFLPSCHPAVPVPPYLLLLDFIIIVNAWEHSSVLIITFNITYSWMLPMIVMSCVSPSQKFIEKLHEKKHDYKK